jgi:hypothetical protein
MQTSKPEALEDLKGVSAKNVLGIRDALEDKVRHSSHSCKD